MKIQEIIVENFKDAENDFSKVAELGQVLSVISIYRELVKRNQFQGDERNIDWWRKQGWDKFKSAVESKASLRTKTQLKRNKIIGNANILQNDNDWLILVPLDDDASCYYGKNTNWCTSKRERGLFKVYTDRLGAKLIYFINKHTNEKWAIVILRRGNLKLNNQANDYITVDDFERETGLEVEKYVTMVSPRDPVPPGAKRDENNNLIYRNKQGELHRTDGPAVIKADGTNEWWIHGEQLSQDEFDYYREVYM